MYFDPCDRFFAILIIGAFQILLRFDYMKLLYELQVSLDAMVVGLEGIKTASLERCQPSQQSALAPYFDHLIAKMSTFKSGNLGSIIDN